MAETLTFYVAMGFEITYQQARPNTYACVRRGGIELHFFTLRELDPAQSYSTCYILVTDVNALYQAFAGGLRAHYGRLPVAGIPRLTPLRNKSDGMRGFNVVDPGGNWIRIGQRMETPEALPQAKTASTKLSRAIQAADLLADSKGDFAAAAKLLDAALKQDEVVPVVQRAKALILRAGLAVNLGDSSLARHLLAEMRQIRLEDDERASLGDEMQRAEDLEQMIK
jgi:hypothetical protein